MEVLGFLQATQESHVLNCGYGKGSSVKEVIFESQHVTGKDLNATIGARRAGDISALVSDPTRLIRFTGLVTRTCAIARHNKHFLILGIAN